jgi:hypothetical protein
MRKKYVAILFCAVISLSFTAKLIKPIQQPSAFKNLTVLPQDIGKEALDSVMRNFSVSLGVRCGFCHAASADTTQKRLDFASDQKMEKNIARDMFKMTANINSSFFNWDHSARADTIHAVVCYTCHRGGQAPDSKAFLATIDSTVKSFRKNAGSR